MSYPKPLSEKSLNRLYMQAGLSTETCAFLHPLFAACANLYGTIALRDVWSVYQELKSDVPRIHRRDLIAFSAIVRREVQPYRVYEIEELYTEEPHNDLDRHIVSKELIGAGYWPAVFGASPSSAYPLACNASNSHVAPFSRLGKKLCMAVEAFPSSST